MSRHFIFAACILAWLMTGAGIASGATITWTNTVSGNWNATTNWSPNQIPGAADTAFITTSGSYTVTLNANAQVSNLVVGAASGIQNLTVSSSTLTLTNCAVNTNGILNLPSATLGGVVTIRGTLNCSGTSFGNGAALTIASNGVMNISGSGTVTLNGVLTNAGTVNWAGTSTLQLYNNYSTLNQMGAIVNLAGAQFNAQNDETINGNGSPYFINAGAFIKSPGVNTTTLALSFTNTGVLSVASGTVALTSGGAATGIISGVGNVNVPNGTLIVNGVVPNLTLAGGIVNGVSATITNLTWSSGILQGTNVVINQAGWTGGSLGSLSTLTIASNGVMNISGSGTLTLNGTLTNAGTVNWTGTSTIQLYNNYSTAGQIGAIVNLVGAQFNAQTDQIMNGNGTPYFINAGKFVKSPGVGITILALQFTNTGVLNVASGTVALVSGGADTGIISGVGNVSVPIGMLVVNGVVPNLILAGGTVNGVSATITNLTWNSGTLQGTNVVINQASWTGGNLGSLSTLTIASNGVMNISGNGTVTLNGALTNAGTVNWTGTSTIQLYNNYSTSSQIGAIVNLAGAQFNAQTDQIMNGNGSPYFINAGTFLKSPGVNNTLLTLLFTNTGVLNVASGAVVLFNGGVDTGIISGAGNVTVQNGTLTVNGVVPNLTLAGGIVNGISATVTNLTWTGGILQGTNLVINQAGWTGGSLGSLSTLTIASSGVLNISGNGTVTLNGTLTNAGTVNWTGTPTIQLYNNYSTSSQIGAIVNLVGAQFNVQNDQTLNGNGSPYFINAGTFSKLAGVNTTVNLAFTNTGTMALNISNRTSFGKISFSGKVALAGSLNANFQNTYSPAIGDSFALLTYGSESGTFSTVTGPASAWWQTNYVTYGASAFTVTIGSLYKLVFTPVPVVTTNAGAVFAPIVIQAEALNGTPLATNGAPVTMTLSSGSGVLSGTVTQNTDATGKATFNNLSINLAGPKVLQAASPPWITPTNAAVTIIAGAPAQLQVLTPIASPQKQGYPFSPGAVVQVQDQFGNTVSNSTLAVTAHATSSGSGTLGGTTGTNASGASSLAVFNRLHYTLGNPNLAETVAVYFSSPGLKSATNSPVTVNFACGFITLTNGNSVVQIDPNSQSGVFAWTVDGTDQLYQHWFWLRETNNPQVSFDQLGTPLGVSVTSSNATFEYLPPGLSLVLSFTLNGGSPGSHAASLSEAVSLQNMNSSSNALHVYDYADFDLGGTGDAETVAFPTANSVVQQGAGLIASQMVQPAPSYWEASWYAFAYDTINGTAPAVLSDSLIPNQAGDQTFALQWDAVLGGGQTLALSLANTIQMPQLPGFLSLARSGPNLLLTWPTNGADNLKLQSNTNLATTSSWTTVATIPATVGTNYQVGVPPAGHAQFYRLHP